MAVRPAPDHYKKLSGAVACSSDAANSDLCCGRYIARIFIALLLLCSVTAQAVTCRDYVAPGGEVIRIETEDTMTYISLPSVLEDKELEFLSLWFYPNPEDKDAELSVPLFFRIEDGVAKSFFHASSILGELEVHAKYGDDICGPRLSYRFAI